MNRLSTELPLLDLKTEPDAWYLCPSSLRGSRVASRWSDRIKARSLIDKVQRVCSRLSFISNSLIYLINWVEVVEVSRLGYAAGLLPHYWETSFLLLLSVSLVLDSSSFLLILLSHSHMRLEYEQVSSEAYFLSKWAPFLLIHLHLKPVSSSSPESFLQKTLSSSSGLVLLWTAWIELHSWYSLLP